ncbi:hypothetical protein ACH4SK_43975 [Streptomyces inhibens]|uniref:hypothetical protein n=1 Tax=Streptomyces inhibens TaxID=2293571 RepID=UPI00378FB4CA
MAQGATRLLWLFFVVEVAFGVVQLVLWWRNRRISPVDGLADPADGHPLSAASW